MTSWCPVFSKIVDSSVWVLPYHVRILWIVLLALKDSDQVVRYNAFGLAKRGGLSEAEVLHGLEVLSKPDKTRLEPQPFEGRRIEKVDAGWKVLNGEFYKDMMRQANRAWYKAEHERKRRADGKVKPRKQKALSGEALYVAAEERGDERGAEAVLDEVNAKAAARAERDG